MCVVIRTGGQHASLNLLQVGLSGARPAVFPVRVQLLSQTTTLLSRGLKRTR